MDDSPNLSEDETSKLVEEFAYSGAAGEAVMEAKADSCEKLATVVAVFMAASVLDGDIFDSKLDEKTCIIRQNLSAFACGAGLTTLLVTMFIAIKLVRLLGRSRYFYGAELDAQIIHNFVSAPSDSQGIKLDERVERHWLSFQKACETDAKGKRPVAKMFAREWYYERAKMTGLRPVDIIGWVYLLFKGLILSISAIATLNKENCAIIPANMFVFISSCLTLGILYVQGTFDDIA